MENQNFINCHVHTFTRANVPDNFLPFWLRPLAFLLKNYYTSVRLREFLERFNQHGLAQLVKKYHAFLNIGAYKTQREVFLQLKSVYPEGTKFCVLSMDLEFMEAGKVKQSFIEQLNELADLKAEFPDLVLPFIFVHPERKNIFDIVKYYIEQKGFAGIKLYPPLGYYPFDSRLDDIYAYAEKNKIPVISHCARGGVYYRGKITDEMLTHPITGVKVNRKENKFVTDIYTDPANYEYVLQKYPNLKLCLAHFGGFEECENYLFGSLPEDKGKSWYEIICALIKKHPNVYTDTAYTFYRTDIFLLLKIALSDPDLKSRILFGSDFYMVEQESSERQFFMNLFEALNDGRFMQIAKTNNERFLTK